MHACAESGEDLVSIRPNFYCVNQLYMHVLNSKICAHYIYMYINIVCNCVLAFGSYSIYRMWPGLSTQKCKKLLHTDSGFPVLVACITNSKNMLQMGQAVFIN